MIIKKLLLLTTLLFLTSCSFVFDSAYNTVPLKNNQVLIALLLPLSGSNEAVGNRLLQAAQFSYVQMNNHYITLKVYDIGFSQESVKEAATQAIKDNVSLVIGPLRAEDTILVSDVLKSTTIPMITLSNDITTLKNSDSIYTTGFLPLQEIESIVEYAALKLNSKRFAVLVPENKYGDLILAASKESISIHSLDLVRVVTYPANEVNLSSYIQKLIPKDELKKYADIKRKLDNKEEVRDEEGNIIKRPPNPMLDFDTLIIGDYGRNLIIVSAHFPSADIDTQSIKILGNSLWDNIENLRDNNIRNSYFATYSSDDYKTDMSNAYEALYNRKVTSLEASIIDAIIVASSLVYLDSEDNLVNNIVGYSLANDDTIHNGIFGRFTISSDGAARRSMFIKQISIRKSETIANTEIANTGYNNEEAFNNRKRITDYKNLEIIENREASTAKNKK